MVAMRLPRANIWLSLGFALMAQRIEIDDALLEKASAKCPSYLSMTGFINLMLDKALDWDGTLGVTSEAGTPSTLISKPLKKRISTYIEIDSLINEELSFCASELIAWWALRRKQYGRQAIGTEQAWNASQNALLSILRVHGRKVVQDTVTAALANGWRGFRESYAVLPKAASRNQPPEPTRHPAAREFRNGKFVDEEPVTNPVLAGLL